MSFFKRSFPVAVLFAFLVACAAPVAPPTPATEQAAPLPSETPAPPVTETPALAHPQPPLGTPVAHLAAGQEIKLTFIHMLNTTGGWAAGGPNGSSDHIFRTSDGGQTWQDVTPPEPASADPQTPKKALGFFMDHQKAWVAFSPSFPSTIDQAYIWRTIDSGATWHYTALTDPTLYQESYLPSDLTFIDAQRGWMIAHVGAGMNHDYFALLATTDGGLTWQTLVSPQNDASGTQSCSKSGMVFASPQDGWMAISCHGVVPVPYIFKSQDGGATWTSLQLPPPASVPDLFAQGYCNPTHPRLFTPTSGVLILTCVAHSDLTTTEHFLYETTDGGATWNASPYPGGRLQFVGATTAFALGRDIQRSDDSGHIWQPVAAVNWDGQFSFIDSQTAWAVATNDGQVALVKTADGGLTWEEIQPKVAP